MYILDHNIYRFIRSIYLIDAFDGCYKSKLTFNYGNTIWYVLKLLTMTTYSCTIWIKIEKYNFCLLVSI